MSKPKLSAVHAVIIITAISIIAFVTLYLVVSHSEIGVPVEFSGKLRGISPEYGMFNYVEYEFIIGNGIIGNVTDINERAERYLVSLIDKDITLLLWEYESHYKYVGAYINE